MLLPSSWHPQETTTMLSEREMNFFGSPRDLYVSELSSQFVIGLSIIIIESNSMVQMLVTACL